MGDASAEATTAEVGLGPGMRRDLVSAYVAAGARVASWVIVGGIVYRVWGEAAFAMLAVVRAVLAVLNYSSLGLGPAMIHQLANAGGQAGALPVVSVEEDGAPRLEYARPMAEPKPIAAPRQVIYYSGLELLVGLVLVAGAALVVLATQYAHVVWQVPEGVGLRSTTPSVVIGAFGLGILLRLMSDGAGAVLQTSRRIATDNVLLTVTEAAWVVLVALAALSMPAGRSGLEAVSEAFLLSSLLLLVARMVAAESSARLMGVAIKADRRAQRQMLRFGATVTLAQMADYLYAPVSVLLIKFLISPLAVATYAPAIQIDAGLFLLVSAIGAVLLPRSAVAHAAGDTALLRRYYVLGTLASVGILAAASLAVWLASPWIFRLWLGNEMTQTQAILGLVLIHMCIGGSAVVGRSILLAMGRVGAYTASVWVAGVLNVVLGTVFVRYLGWGINGVVLGTVVAVTVRCVGWMPWYVLRVTRRTDRDGGPAQLPPTTPRES